MHMSIKTQAIELNGLIDKDHHLILDEAVPVDGPKRVKVIVFFPEEENTEEAEWMASAASNEAFDFLNDPEEDIYSKEDGRPFNA